MESAANDNLSPPPAHASLTETKYMELVKHVIIEVPEELRLSNCCIYKVPCNLRGMEKDAYTPQCISIGPIHDFKKFEPMQEHKLRYFQFFGKRVGGSINQMEAYKHYLETEEKKIRQCYAEIPKITKDIFVDMMLLDAVFIMELMLRNCELKSEKFKNKQGPEQTESSPTKNNDVIMTQSWLRRKITGDLILIENQIPFFVLHKLYNVVLAGYEGKQHKCFVDLAIEYFTSNGYEMSSSDETKKQCFSCILHYPQMSSSNETKKQCFSCILHYPKEPCKSKGKDRSEILKQYFTDHLESNSKVHSKGPKHFTDLIRCFYLPTKCETGHVDNRIPILRTATKLRVSGVSFEKGDVDQPLLDITFKKTPILSSFLCFGCFRFSKFFKARLRIPQLKVDHTTECVFRNLIAFEQFHYPDEPYFCNYVSFIDSLIHTQLDVELLVEKEVIVHELGSHKEVATLVNGLCKNVVTNSTCYYDTIKMLNDHYMSDWNRTFATLRLVYFRDLWRASGTVVGIAVLVFSVFQFIRVCRYLF